MNIVEGENVMCIRCSRNTLLKLFFDFFGVFFIFLSISPIAGAVDFRAPEKTHWVFVASAQDIDTAIGIARIYGSRAQVVSTQNGWFGVALGPLHGTMDEIRRDPNGPRLPVDAFLAKGTNITGLTWELKDSTLATATLTKGHPTQLKSGDFEVIINRADAGNVSIFHLIGKQGGRQIFELERKFENISEFSTEAKLVHLNEFNSNPDVVFEVFTGGAHCCIETEMVTINEKNEWIQFKLGEFDGAGPNYEDIDSDGIAELIERDDSFLYKFAPYVDSFTPIKIYKYNYGTIKDYSLSPKFSRRVVQDVRALEFIAKNDPGLWKNNGFLAAWIADKIRIGEGAEAWAKMLYLYDQQSSFTETKCLDNLALSECPVERRVPILFPTSLQNHLETEGYFGPSKNNEPTPSASYSAIPSSTETTDSTASKGDIKQSGSNSETAEHKSESLPVASGTTSYGTGFFVARDTVITNAHVVAGCETVIANTRSGALSGQVLTRDVTNDLAVIRVQGSSEDFARIRIGARLGEDIALFGFPLTGILSTGGNFTRGSITALAGMGDDTRFLQISAPVQPGNSGGPLLDQSGNVVGVVVAKINVMKLAAVTDDIAQNVNFAINASVASSFLQAKGIEFDQVAKTEILAPADVAALAQKISTMITCRTQ